MLVSVTFGNENFARSSSKYMVFACRTDSFPLINPQQQHLWLVGKNSLHGVAGHGAMNVSLAAPGCTKELGKWTTTTYDVPEGFVLKLYGQKTQQERIAVAPLYGDMYLSIREDGPLVQIMGSLTGDPRAERDSVCVFEGRADILTSKEVKELGIRKHSYYANDVDPLFTTNWLAPEVSGKLEITEKEIESTTGNKTKIKKLEHRRAIEI